MIFWLGTIIFIATYVLIASEKVHKTTAALLGAMAMLLFVLPGPPHDYSGEEKHSSPKVATDTISREVTTGAAASQLYDAPAVHDTGIDRIIGTDSRYNELDVFARHVNFDVVFTLAGMMLLVNILSGTGLFQYVAIRCAKLGRGQPTLIMILLVAATAVLSAFLDNVTTVLLIAPVTLVVASELGVNPIPFLVAETMSSNIGGSATLIGDPPNLIIGSAAKFDFMAFIINLSPFIVVLTLIYCVALYIWYGKRMRGTIESRARIMELDEKAAISDPANLRRGGLVALLTIVGFLVHGMLGLQPSVVAMTGATVALLVCKVDTDQRFEKVEWSTLFFFIGLFVVVRGAEEAGLMRVLGTMLSYTSSWPPLVTILVVMWGSAIIAGLMNNVSYTAAVISIISAFLSATPTFQNSLELSRLMWWGLALAVCLGGNGTIVGAAANLVVAGISEKNGHRFKFTEFLRYSIPITLFSMIAASLYIIMRYMMI